MLTLTEFLLARIAEDEERARDAYYDGQVWIPEEEAVVAADRDLEPILYLDRKRDAAHAYRWSPSRVLAECEAKRRIVELHKDGGWSQGYTDDGYGGHEHACASCGAFGEYGVPYPCATLRALALPYADQPDYREEWRP